MPAELRPLVMPVRGLPPMPAELRSLVMPVRGLPNNVSEALTIAFQGLKIADGDTISHNEASDDDEDDDITIAVMRQGENDTKRKFNWADLCDSDVEDDEF